MFKRQSVEDRFKSSVITIFLTWGIHTQYEGATWYRALGNKLDDSIIGFPKFSMDRANKGGKGY